MTARRKMHPATKRDRYDRRRPDLEALGRLMAERAGMPPAPVPVPLHRMAAARRAATTTTGERP